MNTLRNDLINKIKQMTEEWLLFINEAINSLSRSLIHDRVFHMRHKILAAMEHSEATDPARPVCRERM